ncbi:MAG: hypothetical protein C0490_04225 [Marivirga sp.]|nr:hypothetical protein [Marivirga sp.]
MESKLSTKAPISAKRVIIYDNIGSTEELTEVSQGVYLTDPNGIRGVVGRAYTLHIELLDGRIYESIPDTLYASGIIDSVYHDFTEVKDKDGATNYGFDVYFNSSSGEREDFYFLWKFTGTYQVETNPELYSEPCGESSCPKPRSCSSYVVRLDGSLEWVKECECCTCWIQFFNDNPIVSDNQLVEAGRFSGIKVANVPVNQWTFMYKVHAEVSQFSLSRQAFVFWKAVQAQKEASSSLFQPVTGRIESNFIQISGPSSVMEGLFYATSITSKSIFITRNDVPQESIIPVQNLPYKESCTKLFPYSSTDKPAYWN